MSDYKPRQLGVHNRRHETVTRYGKLSVVGALFRRKNRTYCAVRCDCGSEFETRLDRLKGGRALACIHCAHKGQNHKHGHAAGKESPSYKSYCMMKTRCTNSNYNQYQDYGGRGIKVCDRWLASFENFLADMGERPSRLYSLDRYPDVNGNYEPGNCRWATRGQQQNNRRVSVKRAA